MGLTNYLNDYDALAGFATGFIVIMVLLLAFLVVAIIALWKVFQKAGKPGWASIVPFYSYYVLNEIAGLHWMYFLLIISNSIVTSLDINIPGITAITNLASLYASFAVAFNLSKRFNKGIGFTICLFFFAPICYMILGFSKDYVYDGNIPVSEHAMFGNTNSNTNNNNAYNQSNYYQNQPQSVNNVENTNLTETVNNMENTNQNVPAFCANCGTKVNGDSRFCPNCGNEIVR